MNLLLHLREQLEKAWSINTTFSPEKWSTKNRAVGQCAVSALLLAEAFGGQCVIIAGDIQLPSGEVERHYWNNIEGIDVDLTWRQFPEGSRIVPGSIKITKKEHLTDNEQFMERYNELKRRVYERG